MDAITQVELRQNMTNMNLHGALGQVHLGRDLAIGLGRCDVAKHLEFAVGQPFAVEIRIETHGEDPDSVELPDFGLPRSLTDTFYQMQLAGITPVLTHPERNPSIQAQLKVLDEWVRDGCLFQVTGQSLTGLLWF